MNWEHIHVVFQTICHILIQRAELLQVRANESFLFRRFPKYTPLSDIGNIFRTNQNLLETILHFQQRTGYLTESGIVK